MGERPLPRSRPKPRGTSDAPRRLRKVQPTSGHLVLVVGPSGAGKDTLIAAARRKFRDDPRFIFPQRVITRPESIGEAHLPVSRREFERLRRSGAFVLAWQAHGLCYGIPVEAGAAVRAGHIVVVNVSRGVVASACAAWPGTKVVEVTVALDALKARLLARARESADDIAQRIARAQQGSPATTYVTATIDNSSHPATAVRRFNALLATYAETNAGR